MFELISTVYASDATNIIGTVDNPIVYGSVTSQGGGFILLFSNLLRFVFVIAGILALISFFIAGFKYMMAAGDSKKLQEAWDRIWQSMLGLAIIVASFIIAVLLGVLFFGDPLFILQPKIYGPS